MKIVWQLEKATVRDVYEELLKHRKIAYTTVMTTLDRLEKKGTLKRKKSGKAFVYSAAMTESELRQLAVQHLVDEYFQGSRESLLGYLQSGPEPVVVAHTQHPPPRLDPSLL